MSCVRVKMPAENSWNVNDVLKSPELLVLNLNVGEFGENVKVRVC